MRLLSPADAARLDEHPERAAKVLGMRESLELPHLVRGQWAGFQRPEVFQDTGQEFPLGAETFGREAGSFANEFNGGKIDVRGEVLLAR